MRFSIWKTLYGIALCLAVIYAFFELRGDHGIAALVQKRQDIREMEQENQRLHKQNEEQKQRIQRLESDPNELDLEIRKQFRMVKPGEKVLPIDGAKAAPGAGQPSTAPIDQSPASRASPATHRTPEPVQAQH